MKIDGEQLRMINALESVSGVGAKDCIIDEKIISFLVPKKDVGKAIGKNAENVKKLNNALGKNIEILPHTAEFSGFLKGAMKDVSFVKITIVDGERGKEALVSLSPDNRIKLREKGRKLKRIKKIAERNYNIENIRIG